MFASDKGDAFRAMFVLGRDLKGRGARGVAQLRAVAGDGADCGDVLRHAAMLASATHPATPVGTSPLAHGVSANSGTPALSCKAHLMRANGEKQHLSTYAINTWQPQ